MRTDLLKAAEIEFMTKYPGGFTHPEMAAIKKKHRPEKMQEMARTMFAKDKFGFPNEVIEDMIKIISRASMISVFEKPKFRDYARSLSPETKEILSNALYEQLHGNQELGFNQMLEILVDGKMAKWSLMSIIPYYYYPLEEPFMKPTTVKGIVRIFELENLVYKPRPSYEFYIEYRRQFLEMKKLVNPLIGTDNAAFSGFLMMTMDLSK